MQPGLSASANSRTDTAYYSPARDLAATAALAVDHTLYQRYDTVWSQQLLAGGGSYWQKNHAAGRSRCWVTGSACAGTTSSTPG